MHSECQGSTELVWSSSLVEVEVKVELVCRKVVLMEGRKVWIFDLRRWTWGRFRGPFILV